MKNIKYLFLMVFSLLVVSCNSDDDGGSNVNDSALVGSWGAKEIVDGVEYDLTITFNANGSGTIVDKFTIEGETETETTSFTWKTSGNKLTISIPDEPTDELTYAISGNRLTITGDDFVSVFTKL